MKLAVVTLIRPNAPAPFFGECVTSVKAALPAYGVHQVWEATADRFQEVRWQTATRTSAEYVAWVDDDDRVLPWALAAAVDVLDRTGAGIAFTHEQRIDEDGHPLAWAKGRPHTLRDVAMHPRSLHHLAVFRTDCLRDEIYEHATRIGTGIDWLIRAWCTLRFGAVEIPKVGYEWRQHDHQDTRNPAWTGPFERAMPELRRVNLSWMTHDAPIHRELPR